MEKFVAEYDEGKIFVPFTNAMNCRVCKNFIRVHERGGFHGIIHRRGFCISGKNADFGLTITQTCDECIPDLYNMKTHEIEAELRNKFDTLVDNFSDRRTKEYKYIREQSLGMMKLADSRFKEGKWNGRPMMKFFVDLAMKRELVTALLQETEKDKLTELYKRRHMSKVSYDRMVGYIRLQIENTLRDCLKEAEDNTCLLILEEQS